MDLHKFPLRWFFPIVAALPILLAACLVGPLLDLTISSQMEERLERNLRGLAENISNSSDFALLTKNTAELNKLICSALHLSAEINEIEILDAQSAQVSNCRRMVKINGEPLTLVRSIHPLPRDQSIGPDQITTSPQTIGYVRIFTTKAIIQSEIRQIRWAIFSILTAAVLVTVFFTYFFTRKIAVAVVELSEASKSIASKKYSFSFSKILGGEIGQMQSSFLEMARTMADFTAQLNNNVTARTKELDTQKNLLEKAYTENRRLIHRINNAIENERKAIALDLHDVFNTVILHILGTARQTKSILRKVTEKIDLGNALSNLANIEKSANHLYALSKDLVSNLRPEVLDEFGLAEALKELVDKHGQSHVDCHYSLIISGNVPRFDYDFNIAVYRIVQESLSNVAKHAKATHCDVALTVIDKIDHCRMVLSISDDGIGFDMKSRKQGFGLEGMRERAGGIDANIDMTSSIGAGTKILFSADKIFQSEV